MLTPSDFLIRFAQISSAILDESRLVLEIVFTMSCKSVSRLSIHKLYYEGAYLCLQYKLPSMIIQLDREDQKTFKS